MTNTPGARKTSVRQGGINERERANSSPRYPLVARTDRERQRKTPPSPAASRKGAGINRVRKQADPAAPAGSNFIEPTYYADYEEDVTYLVSEKAEAADYMVICRTLNVRKTPSTEFAPIAKIHRGDIVSVVDWVGDWAKIEWATAEDGYAYVYGAYIEKI